MEFDFTGSPMTATDAMMLGDDYFLSLTEQKAKPDVLSTAAAAFRIHNPVSSTVEELQMREAFGGKDGFEPQAGYNVYDTLENDYWDEPELFQTVKSPDEAAFVKASIDSQYRNRQILEESGGMGIALMMAAGVADPVLLPLSLMGGIGFGAVRGAIQGAALATAEMTAQEMLLHETQITRTWQESMYAIGVAPLFGAALGSVGGAMTKSQINRTMRDMQVDLDDIAKNGGLHSDEGRSGGAASVVGTLKEEQPIGRQGPAISPQLRLLDSESPSFVNFLNRTSRHDLISGKNMDSVDTATGQVVRGTESEIPMETSLVRDIHVTALGVIDNVSTGYKAYIGSATKTMARLRGRVQKGTLSLPDFRREVGKAMRKGDVHENAHIQKAAQDIRKTLDSTLERMKAVDMLVSDIKPKYALSYLTRIYDTKYIEKFRSDWDDMLNAHFESKGMDKLEAKQAAGDVTDHILIHGTNPTNPTPGAASPTKARTLDIDDAVLEKFLVNDIEAVMETYARKTLPKLHWLEKHGTMELDNLLQKGKDEYRILIDKAKSDNKPKIVSALEAKLSRDIADITDARDLYLGNFNVPRGTAKKITNASRGIRGITVTANLGSMTLAAIPDISMNVFKHGMRNTAIAFGQFATSMGKKAGVSRRAITDAGMASEMTLGSRLLSITDLEDATPVGKTLLKTFSNVALMGPWNNAQKTMSAFASQHRIIKGIFGYKKLSDLRRGVMASNGISEYTARTMQKQLEKHRTKFRGGWIPNTDKWGDRALARKFDDIIFGQTEMSIVTPGILDKPTMMNYETGRLVFMFKSFMFAAHHQILLPLAQRLPMGDVQALNGLLITGSLAMFSEWSRMATSGRLKELEDYSAQDWARAAVDRSGWAAVPMDGINIVDRITGGRISKAIGLKEGSKYFYKNKAGMILGPAGGTALGVMDALGNLTSEDGMTASDIHGIRRILPYQNIFYTRWLFNMAEEAAAAGRTRNRRTR